MNQTFTELKNGQTMVFKGEYGDARIAENYKGFLILLQGGNGWCSIYAAKPINDAQFFKCNVIPGTTIYHIGSSDCAMHCREWCDKLLSKHKISTDVNYKIDNSKFLYFTEQQLY